MEKLSELRKYATELIQHSPIRNKQELQLIIEDTRYSGDNVQEQLFIWEKPETDTGISVSLSWEGKLLDYAVDADLCVNEDAQTQVKLSVQELQDIGEYFINQHYPDVLAGLAPPEIEERGNRVAFSYSQYATGMKLPRSGIWIDVHHTGFIVSFKYFGTKQEPNLPDNLISPDLMMQDLSERLKMNLYFNVLSSTMYEGGDDQFHLIYIPDPYLSGQSALLPQPEEDNLDELEQTEDTYNPCAGSNEKIIDYIRRCKDSNQISKPIRLEDIGISENDYEIVREVKSESERKVVYRRRNNIQSSTRDAQYANQSKMDSDSIQTEQKEASKATAAVPPYSLSQYFEYRHTETVKVRINTDNEQITGFVFLEKEKGLLYLNEEECLDIALEFLYRADPLLFPYLKLDQFENDSIEEHDLENDDIAEHINSQRNYASFRFSICKENVACFLYIISIRVNRTTGKVTDYMGGEPPLGQLASLSPVPAIDMETAKSVLLNALEPRLQWEIDYQNEEESEAYIPYYKWVEQVTGKSVYGIDAQTGYVIMDKQR